MSKFTYTLDNVRVAAPCEADWDEMMGDERVRFCGQCSLNVYNLSSMTRKEAESLISRHEGRLCVRYYRRADGSILTNNCPVGLRAIKRRVSRVARATISTVLSFFAGLGVYAGLSEKGQPNYSATMGARIAMPVEEKLEAVEGEMEIVGQPLLYVERVKGKKRIRKSTPR
jgi:hypothetical protein